MNLKLLLNINISLSTKLLSFNLNSIKFGSNLIFKHNLEILGLCS